MSDQEKRPYQMVYIIQPDLDEAGIEALNERISQTIANQNGEIVETEVWGRRSLAYPIGNFFEGYYMVHHLRLVPDSIGEIEQMLRYSEDVIRFLTMSEEEEELVAQ